MAKHEFGTAIEDDDILVIQGIEYPMQPFGMDAFRASMKRAKEVEGVMALEGEERTGRTYDVSVDLIVSSVQEEHREALLAHLNRSVGPILVSRIAAAIMRGFATDVDPTQPTSSSAGSSETGPDSTDGVSPEA